MPEKRLDCVQLVVVDGRTASGVLRLLNAKIFTAAVPEGGVDQVTWMLVPLPSWVAAVAPVNVEGLGLLLANTVV